MTDGSDPVQADQARRYIPPALGERRAIGGYYPQYHGGAGLILDALRRGALEWIRVADPRAGGVDDLQIGTPGRVDAYQFKWSQYPGSFTFRALTVGGADDPPLVGVLADGWTRLRQVHPGRRVVVHLRTNDQPSVNDTPGAVTEGARHFSAFVQTEWIPRSTGGAATVPGEMWRQAWRTMEEASGLEPAEFARFVTDCRLEFGASLPGPMPAVTAAHAREEDAYRRDLDALNLALQRWVADPRRIVELSRDELIAELGWQERLEFRSVHRFPDPSPYREVATTARALAAALAELSGGYIILLGTPGSGKSTLLSNALRYRRERVIHYYAFVPDTPNAHRGESVNFLHDIVLELSRRGFPTPRALPVLDVEVLSGQFREQLRAIADEYRETGRKTILVVDGLDHIVREQEPYRALLRDLPEPGAVPEGVYLVLGSQTDALPGLPASVKVQIEEPARRIRMAPMEPGEVIAAVASAGLQPEPSPEEARRISDISGGHPLALAYVLNRLRSAQGQPVADVLDLAEPYGGEIAVQYRAHWDQIADDFTLVRLLSLLARVRGPIRTEWVEGWAEPEPWHRLHLRFGHYFRREHSGDLRFFHNSFRAFLLERTRGAAGLGGPAGDAGLYRQLAEYSRMAPEGAPARWDEIHYLAMARDIPGVAAAASRTAVTEQFIAGRAPGAILEDIRLALSVVGGAHDEVLLARMLLLAAEFERRTRSLADVSLEDLLLDLVGPAAALTHARDDRRLLISPGRAFALARQLQELGWEAEAAMLFSLAEPVDVLSGTVPVSGGHGGNLELLEAWAETAPRFRPLAAILRAAEQLRVAEARGDWDRLPPHILRARVQLAISYALADLAQVSEWEEVVGAWNPGEESDWNWWFYAHHQAWQTAWLDGQRDWARELATRASAAAAQRREHLVFRERVALATAAIVFNSDFDSARDWVGGLGQPAPVDVLQIRGDEGIAPWEDLFALSRVLGAMGDDRPLMELVPDRAAPGDRALSLLERQVALAGRLWGRAWRGDRLGPGSFMVEIGPMLRLVRHDHRETGAYWASRARPALHAQLIRVAAAHGPEVLRALRDAFEREWQADETGPLWSADHIRDLLLAFVRQDGQLKMWACGWLTRLELRVFEAEDIEERVSEGVAFARAAAELGDVKLGQRLYHGVLWSSFGLARKDFQMSSWVELAARANSADPDATPVRLGTLIGYSTLLDVSEDEKTVLETLLRLTSEWDLAAGIRLLEWDLENGLLEFPAAVGLLLDQALASNPTLVGTVSALCRHVVLNLHPRPPAGLLRGLAETLVQSSAASADEGVAKLEHAILTCARASERARLLAVLADVRQIAALPAPSYVAAPPAVQAADPDDKRSIPLTGEEISLNEAKRRAADVESVREMLRQAVPGAYQRWGPVVEPLAAQLDASSASELAEVFQGIPDSGDVLSLVAQRLAELGASERAWQVAERAFVMTRPTGWVEYYDGGVRRRAVEVMVTVDPVRGRALAWETLVSDVATGNVRAQDAAWALPWILSLFAAAPDVVRVWTEIDAYLSALFAHARASEPPRLERGSHAEGAAEILAGWAARYLDHPTMAVAGLFRRCFVDLLLSGERAVHSTLGSILRAGAPSERRAALLVLRSAAEVEPGMVLPVAAELRGLLAASDHALRGGARTILDQLGESVEHPDSTRGPGSILSGTTTERIHLRPRGGVRDRHLERGEPLPLTADPVELTGSIEDELGLLARLSGLQRESLQYRVAEMMRVVDQDVGSPNEEKSIKVSVRRAGLDLGSFRRPRAKHARDALFRLIAALEDEGKLDPDELEVFDHVFRYDDPAFLRQAVSRRPASVPPIPERAGDRSSPQDWTDLVSTGNSALQQPEDQWVILAEWSKLRWLDWKRPTETRFGVRLPTSRVPLPNIEIGPHKQCSVLHHVRVAEYPDTDAELGIPVVYNHTFRMDALGHGWLAFNPALARHLNWSPDVDTGLFRWRDEAGEIAGETVWWTDGFLDLKPPHFEEEVGKGWLVRISHSALTQLEGALGPLGGVVHVLRRREGSPLRSATEILDSSIPVRPEREPS